MAPKAKGSPPKKAAAKRPASPKGHKKKKASAAASSPGSAEEPEDDPEAPEGFKAGVIAGESAITKADVVLQASAELESQTVGEVPAGTVVYVLDVQEMLGGAQRAMVTLGDPAKGHLGGWMTSVSLNGSEYLAAGESFVRPNAEVTPAQLTAAMEEAAIVEKVGAPEAVDPPDAAKAAVATEAEAATTEAAPAEAAPAEAAPVEVS